MLRSRLSKLSDLGRISRLVCLVGLGGILFAAPCVAAETPKDLSVKTDSQTSAEQPGEAAPQPCITGPSIATDKIPRFAVNSPFGKGSGSPAIKKERMLWAQSWIWTDAPEFVVEKWLTDEPDMEGKYVLIEFWATWCPPCRRSLSLLNEFHRKYGDELVVIGVCEENEENTRKLNEKFPDIPKIEFYSAIDTQKRMKDKLRVWGIPHAIVVEPNEGVVIWEGFPLQENYELTDKIVERILEIGRKLRAKRESVAAE